MPNNAEKGQNRDSNAFPVARTQTMMWGGLQFGDVHFTMSCLENLNSLWLNQFHPCERWALQKGPNKHSKQFPTSPARQDRKKPIYLEQAIG